MITTILMISITIMNMIIIIIMIIIILTLLKAGHGDRSEDVGALLRQLPRWRCVTLDKLFIFFNFFEKAIKII